MLIRLSDNDHMYLLGIVVASICILLAEVVESVPIALCSVLVQYHRRQNTSPNRSPYRSTQATRLCPRNAHMFWAAGLDKGLS